MNIITISKENLDKEHICCAISNNKDCQVSAVKPQFKASVKNSKTSAHGFMLYYVHQCPYTAKYVPLIEKIAQDKGVPLQSIRFLTTEQVQNASAPFTSYSLFYNGGFVTNEILSEKKFEKMITEFGL